MKILASIALVAVFAVAGQAQIVNNAVFATVGPQDCPIGCDVQISLTNAGNTTVGTGACFFTVNDVNQNPVFAPFFCILILIPIGPGDTFTAQWDQTDNGGNQVPPGIYFVNVQLPSGLGTTTQQIEIGNTTAGLTLLGAPIIGTSNPMHLCAPASAGQIYGLLASAGTTTGFPTCAGLFPLDNDFVLQLSLQPNNGFLTNGTGFMDGNGINENPSFIIPFNPGLVGAIVNFAFLTVDLANPVCPISDISPAYAVTIL